MKEASKKEMKKLKSKNIQTIDVSKGKESIKEYGKKAKDGVIKITTKKGHKKKHKKGTGFDISINKTDIQIGAVNDNNNPLMFIDGKKISHDELKKIDSNQIESVNVYKEDQAIKKYGDQAKNGVVEITLKK